MTGQTITLAGARGGSGTTTVACALALFLAGHVRTELVADDLGTTGALLGLTGTHDAPEPVDAAARCTPARTVSGNTEIAVIDAQQLDQLDIQPEGGLLVVLRGPCYLGLRTITTTSGVRADGIVLLMEVGRSLTRRDVSDVCDVPVIAEIAVAANVARTIDAGLLVTRLHRLPEFRGLRRYASLLIASNDNHPASDAAVSHAHPSQRETASTIVTDLPGPLNGPSRALGARVVRGCVLRSEPHSHRKPLAFATRVGEYRARPCSPPHARPADDNRGDGPSSAVAHEPTRARFRSPRPASIQISTPVCTECRSMADMGRGLTARHALGRSSGADAPGEPASSHLGSTNDLRKVWVRRS